VAHRVMRPGTNGAQSAAQHIEKTSVKSFEIHINEKRCPAHKCAGLIRYRNHSIKCVAAPCAPNAVRLLHLRHTAGTHVIDQTACIKCGECFNVCKFDQ